MDEKEDLKKQKKKCLKKFIKKLLVFGFINLFVLILLLYAIEFFLSPYKTLPVNGLVNDKLYTWGHPVTNNELGFREREVTLLKPDGVFRVMVLGDSLTWGAGLAVDERYTAIAEKLLNNAFGGNKIEVLNFGFPGGPTVKERDILIKLKDKVRPDIIVIGFCLNDPQHKPQDYSPEKEVFDKKFSARCVFKIERKFRRLGLRYVGELFRKSFYAGAESLDIIPSWQVALNRTYDVKSSEWKNFVQALRDIKNMSDKMNLPRPVFIILNQGTFPDRLVDYANPDAFLKQYLKWYHQVERVAGDAGFYVYNHEKEIIKQLPNEALGVNIVDAHPSVNLNKVYGKKLFQVIRTIVSELATKKQIK